MDIPLTEDDLAETGIIEPGRVFISNEAPSCAVMCFFQEVIEGVEDKRVHATLTSIYGGRALYEIERRGERVAFFYPGLGAPAAVSAMEEAIAMGCRNFVAVGGAGALLPELALGDLVVLERALRDEGTSFHYAAPSRFSSADEAATESIIAALSHAGLPFRLGSSWTTDAIYRETKTRAERRVAEGCSTVEMEASALFAIGRYRGVRVGQFVYAGDTLASKDWDDRSWTTSHDLRRAIFDAALDAAIRLGATRTRS
jgi:uridine phosphorylase